ncbi:MAG: ankyrin repeat domain-containing protein [Syntrophobacterales bacterium]
MRKSRCCSRWEGDEVDSGANGVQPHYEQGVEMQTQIESKAALLVIITLVLLVSCASRDERLRIAAYKGDSEETSQLIAAGVEIDAKNQYGNTALIIAAIEGHLKIVKSLIAGGADVNERNRADSTALMLAAKKGHFEIVKALLVAGADVNARTTGGVTALFAAESEGHTAVVEMLKKAGAN